MFLTVGEKLNATRKDVAAALKEQNRDFIIEELNGQLASGANIIDLNGGTTPKLEMEHLLWLVDVVASECDTPLCVDSASPDVIKAAAERILEVRGMSSAPEKVEVEEGLPWLLVNSVNNNDERFESLVPVVRDFNCAVVALCMGDGEAPSDLDERIEIGSGLVQKLIDNGIEASRVYLDPLILPVGVDAQNARKSIRIIQLLKEKFPGLRSICGLSNVSYGLPARSLLNRTFLSLMIANGLDAAIMNPMDRKLMSVVYATRALCDKDEYCMNYITAFREEKLDA